MIQEKRIFSGGIDADTELRLLAPSDYLNAENVRIGISEFSRNASIRNIPSTELLYSDLVDIIHSNLVILRAVDEENELLIWGVYNSFGSHGIYAWDVANQIGYRVLLSSQTEDGFGWQPTNRISRNARVVNGLLIYTDGNNEPQEVNIYAGIKLNQPSFVTNVDPYLPQIPYTTLTLIKRPPIAALSVTKVTDGGFPNNYTSLNAYQFAYYYTYKNNEESALSTFGKLAPLNYKDETFNAIDVYMQFSEFIDDYVQSVTFVVRYGNFGKTFKIRTWDKNNYYDRLAIISQNVDAVQLGFRFYDNVAGIAMDDVTANTSFDNVALKAKTVEVARNRVHLANLLKGYDTPATTSLSLTLSTIDTGGGTSYAGTWRYMTLYYYFPIDPTTFFPHDVYYVVAPGAPINTAFYYTTYRNGGVYPGTLNAVDATLNASNETALAYTIIGNDTDVPLFGARWSYTHAPTFHDAGGHAIDIVTPPASNGLQFFKSSSTYNVSIAFFDRFRRKCGIVQRYQQATIADRTYNQTVFNAAINWSLSNTDAVNEIPDWAYYYQIHITLNQTTRFFVQIYSVNTYYVLKNQDGTYDITQTTFSLNSTYAIGFDVTSLYNNGLGYTYTSGDLIRIYKIDGTNILLPVIGQDVNYVFAAPRDIGTVGSGVTFLIELYTPYKPSITEPFYETGDVLPIVNPTTVDRQYLTLSGTINGDAYAIERDKGSSSLYFVEAMSPNDKVWQVWQTDRGWINIIDKIGQQLKQTSGDYSDTYITGTRTNGVNKFQPLSTYDIGGDNGQIQKLQLTNKLGQQIGTVMLCIATNETLSIYLGETQLVASSQNDAVALSNGVIGSINNMKKSRGTINPESTCAWDGMVFWIDVKNGKVCQYADNGIVDISDYKMTTFWDRYCKRYVEQGSGTIEGLCGFSYIETAIDPPSKELLICLPQTEINTITSGLPVGFAQPLPSYSTLPSYASSVQNRFNVYDGQPKIAVFRYEENKWNAFLQWLPDCQENVGDKLYGFKLGYLYLHNESTDSWNNIYGVNYPQRICHVYNGNFSMIKDMFNASIEGNEIPNYTVLYTDYPNQQITDLTDTDWENQEGAFYAPFFFDRQSPNSTGTPEQRMLTGDVMKSVLPFVMCEFQIYDNELIINFINTGYTMSRGQGSLLLNIKK